MIDTYRSHNLALHDEMVRPYPGVCEVVHALREQRIKLGLVTSKRREGALRGLNVLGLGECFQELVCGDDVVHGKPHPEPVLRALTALDVEPGHTVFVGDSTHDIDSGRAAGVHTAGVLWGPFDRDVLEPSRPHVLVRDAAELRSWLEMA
jgi:pyrophosphatase PpaX